MAKANLEERIRAVLLYTEDAKRIQEISFMMGVSVKTVRRWIRKYRKEGAAGLALHKPGSKKGTGSIPDNIKERIMRLTEASGLGCKTHQISVRPVMPLGNGSP
jgi:transposase